jgi:hypothetical protein
MDYENFKTGFNKAAIFTAQTYGTKTTVEVDHSDLSLDEVMDAFQTLIIGMGYHQNSFKNWVIERAEEYIETDAEELKEKLEAWKFENDDNEVRHSFGEWSKDSEGHEDYNGQFKDWAGETPIEDDEDASNKRMDIIGQNGNEGLHYRATDEDEAEFDDYGARIVTDSSFEWEDDNLFEGDSWFANENLKSANERYKSEVKKMRIKPKKQSKK